MVGKINEDVVVPRDRIAELVARTEEIGARHRFRWSTSVTAPARSHRHRPRRGSMRSVHGG